MKNGVLESLEFDFAFSFAGEDREIVEEIYKQLRDNNIQVFYDLAYQTQLIGKDLYKGLRDLYQNKGKYIVCFVSEHYANKIWTNLEFVAIKERLMATFFASDFLIPILIGDAKMLEDIPRFIGFYNYRSPEETVEMLMEKINSTLPEAHLINHVNNYIEFICPQIQERLLAHGFNAILQDKNKLIIKKGNQTIIYHFSVDTIAQTSCILISKVIQEFNKKNLGENHFPSFIITWKKRDGLYFMIHEFDGNKKEMVKEQPLSMIVKYICSTIEENIGGFIY